jgi:hypothetical protein
VSTVGVDTDTKANMERLVAAEKAAEETVEADEVVTMAEPAMEPGPAPIRKVVQFGRHAHTETAELCSVEVCSGGTQWNVVMDPKKPPPTPKKSSPLVLSWIPLWASMTTSR